MQQDYPTYYSLRQWAPYQGTVQVVEIPGFRAVSRDGHRWQVQVRNEGIRFFTYGTWCADGSGNLIATERTQPLIDALEAQPHLPFPAIDTLELWLLDQDEFLPLALLRSMPDRHRPYVATGLRWQAALSPDGDFVSDSLLRRADQDGQPIPHHQILERCVSAAAGAFPTAQWFRRQPDGSGIGLGSSEQPATAAGRALDKAAFPELLLRERWDEELQSELVADYHAWQAPELLTHATLSSQVRDSLERDACRSARRMYNLRNVLPSIINRDLVNAAFVEGMLRQTAVA